MPAIQRDVNSIIKHKAAVSAPASSLSAVSFNHNFCDRTEIPVLPHIQQIRNVNTVISILKRNVGLKSTC